MHVEQALKMLVALAQAVDAAVKDGSPTVSLTPFLQAADNAARADLAAAIEAAQRRIGSAG